MRLKQAITRPLTGALTDLPVALVTHTPAAGVGEMPLVRMTLPDGVRTATAGKGFCGTGFCVHSNGFYYFADGIGKARDTDPGDNDPSIVEVIRNGNVLTLANVWYLADMGLGVSMATRTIQPVWERAADGDNTLRFITTVAGSTDPRMVTFDIVAARASGAAAGVSAVVTIATTIQSATDDSIRDNLIVCNTTALRRRRYSDLATTGMGGAKASSVTPIDLSYHYAPLDRLYYTTGSNNVDGEVHEWQVATDMLNAVVLGKATVPAKSIEAPYRNATRLMVMSNEYFHLPAAGTGLNQLIDMPLPVFA